MKKIILSFAMLFMIITLSGCNSNSGSINYVQPYEVLEKIDKKESFVLVIGKESCSACQTYADTVKEFSKEHPDTLVYVDLEKIKDKDGKTSVQIEKEFFNKLRYTATPTTYIYKNGEIATFVEGTQSIDKLNSRYETFAK